MTRDPFDDEGEAVAVRANAYASLLVAHAHAEVQRTYADMLEAEKDAHVALERLEHAMRLNRHWCIRAERAIALRLEAIRSLE